MKVHGVLEFISGIVSIISGIVFFIVGVSKRLPSIMTYGYGLGLIIGGIIIIVIAHSFLNDADRLNTLEYELIRMKNEKEMLQRRSINSSESESNKKLLVKASREMTLCKHCGARISKSTLYCPSCGKENE